MQTKVYKLNNIRAIAILLVVFGHSIILYSSQWSLYASMRSSEFLDIIKKLINLIQMPLFFSLSGYLFAFTKFSTKNSLIVFLTKKIHRTIIPFVLIACLWMIPLKYLVGYPRYVNQSYFVSLWNCIINNDSGHLWFLPTLLILFLVFGLLKYLKLLECHALKIGVFLICFLFGGFWYTMPFNNIPYISAVYQHAWAFSLGICLNGSEKILGGGIGRLRYYFAIIVSILSVVDVILLDRNDIVCAALVLIAIYSCVPNTRYMLLERVSNNSFGIYLFHSPLIYITFTYLLNASPWIVVSVNFFIFGLFSNWLTEIMRFLKFNIIIGE